ncbi:MAG: hypothetical protein HRF49_02175 [bacterium]|jgi:hypothetical protein
MLKGEKVMLRGAASPDAEIVAGLYNRCVWREKWELVRTADIEKQLKEGKFEAPSHDWQLPKGPWFIVFEAETMKALGYIHIPGVQAQRNAARLKPYPDPAVPLDEEAWLEALTLARDYLTGDCRMDRVTISSAAGWDPLIPLYPKLGFNQVGVFKSSLFVQGENVDQLQFEYVRPVPYPVTRVNLSDLSGAGGKPPRWDNG